MAAWEKWQISNYITKIIFLHSVNFLEVIMEAVQRVDNVAVPKIIVASVHMDS